MLKALANAFRVPELRKKILFTLSMIVLYRIGSYIPVPGVPYSALVDQFKDASGAMALMNLFSGGALSYFSVFSLGIMPYITAQIILQLMQGVIPSQWVAGRRSTPSATCCCSSLAVRRRVQRPRCRIG